MIDSTDQHADCEICNQIARRFTRENRILFQNSMFTVWPSLGAAELGHLLLIPNRHVSSFYDLNETEKNTAGIILSEIAQMPIFASILLIAEHGTLAPSDELNVTCVDHAHLHIIPSKVPLGGIIAEYLTALPSMAPPVNVSALTFPTPPEYLLIGDMKSAYIFSGSGPFPSQLVRRAYFSLTGRGALSNWRVHPAARVVRETVKTLAPQFLQIAGNSVSDWTSVQAPYDLGLMEA